MRMNCSFTFKCFAASLFVALTAPIFAAKPVPCPSLEAIKAAGYDLNLTDRIFADVWLLANLNQKYGTTRLWSLNSWITAESKDAANKIGQEDLKKLKLYEGHVTDDGHMACYYSVGSPNYRPWIKTVDPISE